MSRTERVLVVFVAASDESKPGDQRTGTSVYGGIVAPLGAWENDFIPAWVERVLEDPPHIPHFHMVDLRNARGIRSLGLTPLQADAKIEEACKVVTSSGFLIPVASRVPLGRFVEVLGNIPIALPGGRHARMDGDFISFSMYILYVLEIVSALHPEASKVDFIFEKAEPKKNAAFDMIFDSVPEILRQTNSSHLVRLLGDLNHRRKDYIPLQAADLMCWYARRASDDTLEPRDQRRFDQAFGRKRGYLHTQTPEWLELFAANAEKLFTVQRSSGTILSPEEQRRILLEPEESMAKRPV